MDVRSEGVAAESELIAKRMKGPSAEKVPQKPRCYLLGNGSTTQFLAVGKCTIAANQSGTATYAPAPQVPQSVDIK